MAEAVSDKRQSPAETARFWLDLLALADREEKDWRREAGEIVDRYRDERSELTSRGTRLNIFAANVQLLQAAVYGQTPAPDVRRRNISEDPARQAAGREVAKLIEKALAYTVDDQPFDEAMEAVRDDMLLTGRGISWEVYEADIERREDVQRIDQPAPTQVVPDALGMPVVVEIGPPPPPVYLLDGVPVEPDFDPKGVPFVEQKTDERTITEYVFWSDFRMSPARRWPDVWWVARRHTMTRRELRKEFGEIGLHVPLMVSGHEGNTKSPRDPSSQAPPDPPSRKSRAEVWEIWDKRDRVRVWVATGFDRTIRTDTDPLGLKDFFPCPAALYGLKTTDTMIPLPEFALYRDQADELDEVQSRLRHLERVLRAVAFTDGDFTEAISVATAEDGKVIPIDRPDTTAGDLSGSIWAWPLTNIVAVIEQLGRRSAELQNQIWQITGIHDLQRGATKERESAAAQKLKSGFGQVRNVPRSLPMARYARDVLRIKAEIMAELFEPATLERISGVPVTPDMMALLREEKLRNTQIAVATDATVRPDVHAEQESAVEFMQASAQFLAQVAQVGAAMPPLLPMMIEAYRQAARTFKFARNLEPIIEQTVAMVAQQVQQQQAQQALMQQQQAQAQAMQAAAMNGGMAPGLMQ